MKPDISNITSSIEKLRSALARSGKSEPALYFTGLIQQICAAPDIPELRKILVEIEKLAPMAQYGGFTSDEERLLTTLQLESSRVKLTLGAE